MATATVPIEGSADPAVTTTRRRRRRLGLRTRILTGFTVGTLLLSAFVAFATYLLTRNALLTQREDDTVREAGAILDMVLLPQLAT